MIGAEILMMETRDSWGHRGTRTYTRGFFVDGHAPAVSSDTSTGHGWGGSISAARWGSLYERATLSLSPFRMECDPSETWPTQCAPKDCEGWMIYLTRRDHYRPWLYPTKARAIEAAREIMDGNTPAPQNPFPDPFHTSRGSIHI